MLDSLTTVSASQRPDLLAPPVAAAVGSLPSAEVFEIDPELAETAALCAAYDLPLDVSANCVVVTGRRGQARRHAGCVVLATTRADVNGLVRRRLDARKASFAAVEFAVAASGMEYGGITPVGLPADWLLLVDAAVVATPVVIIGSGVRRSKLVLPGAALAELPRAEVVEGLGLATDRPIKFRPLVRSDFGRLATWSHQDHVVEWWGPGLSENQIERKYGPRVDGSEPVRVYVIELGGLPIGWIQSYLLADQPGEAEAVGLNDAAGIDVAIGEASELRRGQGRRIIRDFVSTLVFPRHPEVSCCVARPSERNDRALRTFAAAGFRPFSTIRNHDGESEVVMVLKRGDATGGSLSADSILAHRDADRR